MHVQKWESACQGDVSTCNYKKKEWKDIYSPSWSGVDEFLYII